MGMWNKMWGNIVISFISFLALLFMFYGLKNIAHGSGPAEKSLTGDKDFGYERLSNYIINKSGRGRKFLTVIIFFVLTLCFYLFTGNFIFSLFAGICPGIYVSDFLNGFEEKEKDLLNTQIVEFLSSMIVMLKAGNTVRYIFKSSAGSFKNPLGSYLQEIAYQLELNFSLEEALDSFSRKCGSKEINLLVSSLKINNKIGGDLIPVLDNVADNIRHNISLKSRIKTMNTQSRISGNIISVFPVVVLVLMCIFLNDSIMNFFSTGIGIILLFTGGVLEIAGILIIKRITNFRNYGI